MLFTSVLVFLGVFAAGMVGTRVELPSFDQFQALASEVHASGSANSFTCTVASVHDGDTLRCAEGPRVRLSAVAARELDESCSPGHPCPEASGAAARDALQRLVDGKVLTCEQNGTSYNRVTAWCWMPSGEQINCAMVENGYALRWAKFDPEHRMCSRGETTD